MSRVGSVVELRVPGDKSLTHRALLLAALAGGRSRIRAPLISADTLSTAACLRLLGCDVPELAEEIAVHGRGLRGLQQPAAPLDCGNSGTTARLLLGILAGLPVAAELTGDASLRSRPMRRVTAPLSRMGARFEELGEADRLPVRVHGGPLVPLHYTSPHPSAQVKSALLLAGLVAGVDVSVQEPVQSRDHTERMLRGMGVDLQCTAESRAARVALRPAARLETLDFEVPGDFSSAAFMIAAACMSGRDAVIRNVGINPTRTGFLRVLERMNARVEIDNLRERCGEPVADIHAAPSSLQAVHVGAAEIPSLVDEVPVLAVMATAAEGTTVIEGAAELRVKESDRVAALAANLSALGARVEELPEGLVVHGGGTTLRGAVDTRHDHRIAMAFGVLSAVHDGIVVDDPGVVAVSYPDFWRALHRLV